MKSSVTLICSLLLGTIMLNGQESSGKWKDSELQTVITPYLWAPWTNGELSIDRQLKDIQSDLALSPLDVLKSVRAVAMIHTSFNKGRFVADVDYIYLLLKTAGGFFESESGDDLILNETRLKGNVIEFTAGGRVTREIVHFDPYIGLRYSNFRTISDLTISSEEREVKGTLDFWDALIGARITLYPHPKVPIVVQGDIGGFKAGSDFSWTTEVTVGYAVSRLVDIFAGFKTWSFDYAKEGSDNSLEVNMFGFVIGANFHIPRQTSSDDDTGTDLY